MFWTIAITTIINWLVIAVVHYWDKLQNSQREVNRLRKENGSMNDWIKRRTENDQQIQLRRSYDQGLYDGRQTDALYRQMLKKFQSGQQVDVILNGTADQEMEVRNRRSQREG